MWETTARQIWSFSLWVIVLDDVLPLSHSFPHTNTLVLECLSDPTKPEREESRKPKSGQRRRRRLSCVEKVEKRTTTTIVFFRNFMWNVFSQKYFHRNAFWKVSFKLGQQCAENYGLIVPTVCRIKNLTCLQFRNFRVTFEQKRRRKQSSKWCNCEQFSLVVCELWSQNGDWNFF